MPQPGQSRGLTGALIAAFKVLERQGDKELAQPIAERATEADVIEERMRALKPQAPPADLRPFLRPVGVMETRYIRMLSNLSALTYEMHKITVDGIYRRHRLKLVTTSRACDFGSTLNQVSPLQAMEEGDAMAADPGKVSAFQQALQAIAAAPVNSPAMKAVAKVDPISAAPASGSPAKSRPAAPQQASAVVPAPGGQLPGDVVAGSLSAAAAAAYAAAGSMYSAAVPIAAPIASNISAFTSSVTSASRIQSVASQLQSAASAGHSTAVATVATVSAALEATWSRERGDSNAAAACEASSPTEWFVADDADAGVRYFVIQGSDNLDHWRVNLSFDPVAFEDPALGVKVHRGVYETAQILYDRFLPLVRAYLAATPAGRVAFTGHSLGGSLGTLLMLMYVQRGVIPAARLAPVYTFGAPAIFCEGFASGCGVGGSACSLEVAAPAGGGVLGRLGLPQGAVRNVLMHLDIVPRAFACDYSSVSDLLKRVGESFRDHKCLSGNRQVLFNFVGKLMVLQPGEDVTFVLKRGEAFHPLLPSQVGLYALGQPGKLDGIAAQVRRDAEAVGDAVLAAAGALSNLPAGAAAGVKSSTAPLGDTPSSSAKARAAGRVCGKVPASMQEAVWELMNNPHPLDTLSDPGSYGDRGAISRFHNPDNYTRAIGGALRARGAPWRRLVENAKSSGLRFYQPLMEPLPAVKEHGSSPPPQKGGKAQSPPARLSVPGHV